MPAGTDLVVVAGPQVGFLEPELQMLTRFMIGGGRVLLLLDPILGQGGLERTGFGPWLEGYGVKLGEDIVVDPTNPLPFYSAETFFANEYESHPITEALEDANYPVIFSLARSVDTLPQDADAGLKVTQLLRSSPDAWGETDLTKLDAVAKDDADVAGPVGLGVAVEIEAGAGDTGEASDGSLTVLDEDGAAEPTEPSEVEPRRGRGAGSTGRAQRGDGRARGGSRRYRDGAGAAGRRRDERRARERVDAAPGTPGGLRRLRLRVERAARERRQPDPPAQRAQLVGRAREPARHPGQEGGPDPAQPDPPRSEHDLPHRAGGAPAREPLGRRRGLSAPAALGVRSVKPRTLLVLLALVAGLGAFVWFYEREQPGSEEREKLAKRVLGVEREDVVRLELHAGDRTTELVRTHQADDKAESPDEAAQGAPAATASAPTTRTGGGCASRSTFPPTTGRSTRWCARSPSSTPCASSTTTTPRRWGSTLRAVAWWWSLRTARRRSS